MGQISLFTVNLMQASWKIPINNILTSFGGKIWNHKGFQWHKIQIRRQQWIWNRFATEGLIATCLALRSRLIPGPIWVNWVLLPMKFLIRLDFEHFWMKLHTLICSYLEIVRVVPGRFGRWSWWFFAHWSPFIEWIVMFFIGWIAFVYCTGHLVWVRP